MSKLKIENINFYSFLTWSQNDEHIQVNNNRSEENRDPSKDSVVIEKVIDAVTVINELWFQRSNLVFAAIFGWSIVNVE